MGKTKAMKSLKKLLPIVLFGFLFVTGRCWGEGFIIYSVGGDAVYAIQPNDRKPTKLTVDGPLARPSPDGRLLAVWQHPETFDILARNCLWFSGG